MQVGVTVLEHPIDLDLIGLRSYQAYQRHDRKAADHSERTRIDRRGDKARPEHKAPDHIDAHQTHAEHETGPYAYLRMLTINVKNGVAYFVLMVVIAIVSVLLLIHKSRKDELL